MFMCGGQNSWICKAFLRIFDVRLIECKNCYKLPCVEQRITKLDGKSTVLLNYLRTFVFNIFLVFNSLYLLN